MPTRDVVFNIIGRESVSPAANRAAASMEGAAARISRAGDKMVGAGRKMTHTLTLPILALGGAAVKTATDFNSSMTRIQTQAGASAREVQFLTKQVLGMKNAQFGPNAAAESLYHLESVGLRGRKAISDLTQAENLAAVGNADLAETTNALAGAWRTGIRGATSFHQAAATVNAIIGAGNMTLESFNAALGTGILPSAKTFGLSLKDVGSALALFTDEGVPADAAATRLRMTFSLLGAPSGVAVKQLKKIGIGALELGRDLRKPQGLIVAVGDLKKHLDDSGLSATRQSALLSRAFGGGRSSSAILSLVNNFDVLKKKQDQVTASLGKYDHAVQVQQATPQAQFKRSLADLQQTGVLVGRDLLPLVVTGAKDIEHLASAFDSLSPSQKHVAIDALLVVAALGPLLSIGGRIVKTFGLMGSAATRAVAFMAAPYRAQAASATTASLQVQQAQLAQQLATQRAAALIAVAEAEKANAAAESAVATAAALEGTNSMLAADSTAAAENAIEFAAAQQTKADAAVRAAATTDAAWTKATIALRGSTAGATSSMFAMQSAMHGLAIGLTAGTFTRGASTGTKVMTDLGAAGAGAAVGWSMGGPWGAAIGGLTAGLSSLTTQIIGASHEARINMPASLLVAQHAAELAKGAFDQLTGAIQADNEALGRNTRAAVANDLQKRGVPGVGKNVLGAAVSLGIQPDQLAAAVLGNQKALAAIEHLTTFGAPGGLPRLAQTTLAQRKAVYLVTEALGQETRSLQDATAWADLYASQNGKLSLASRSVANEVHRVGLALSGTSDEATVNNAFIQAHIRTINTWAQSQLNAGKSADTVARGVINQSDAFRRNLLQAGFNQQAVDRLFKSYGHIPKAVTTSATFVHHEADGQIKTLQDRIDAIKQGKVPHLTADTGTGKQLLAIYQSEIDLIRQHHVPLISINTTTAQRNLALIRSQIEDLPSYKTVTVNVQTRGRVGSTYGQQVPGGATGFGNIPQGTSTVGERGWELVQRQGNQVSVFPHNVSRAMTGLPAQLPGFASGTKNPAPDLITLDTATKAKHDYLFAHNVYASLKDAVQAFNSALGTLKGSMKSFLAPANLTTVAGSRAQFHDMITSLRAAGGDRELIRHLRADNAHLDDLIRRRVADAARLAKAHQILSSVASSTRGSFDITQAGADANGKVAFGAIRAQETQQLHLIRAWAADLHKLGGVFGKSAAGKAMLLQLAQAGPSSYPQVHALALAGPKALRGIVSTEAKISRAAQGIGGFISTVETGGTIRQHEITLKRDRQDVENEAKRIESAILKAFSQLNLKVEFDARGSARLVASGTKQNRHHRRSP